MLVGPASFSDAGTATIFTLTVPVHLGGRGTDCAMTYILHVISKIGRTIDDQVPEQRVHGGARRSIGSGARVTALGSYSEGARPCDWGLRTAIPKPPIDASSLDGQWRILFRTCQLQLLFVCQLKAKRRRREAVPQRLSKQGSGVVSFRTVLQPSWLKRICAWRLG